MLFPPFLLTSSAFSTLNFLLYNFWPFDLLISAFCLPYISILDAWLIHLLKVHRNENFFGFNFDFCTVSLLVMLKFEVLKKTVFDWAIMGGGRIIPCSLQTTGNKNCFQPRPKFFLFLNIIWPLYC
jgi:hypothetical protein